MCNYEREISFCFDESAYDSDLNGSLLFDNGFESMWQQIEDEICREQELNHFSNMFQQELRLGYWETEPRYFMQTTAMS